MIYVYDCVCLDPVDHMSKRRKNLPEKVAEFQDPRIGKVGLYIDWDQKFVVNILSHLNVLPKKNKIYYSTAAKRTSLCTFSKDQDGSGKTW